MKRRTFMQSSLLGAGALAAPVFKVEERTIGPSLGHDNIERGFNAIKFDLDDANNPHKLDRWNWSVRPRRRESGAICCTERSVRGATSDRCRAGPHHGDHLYTDCA